MALTTIGDICSRIRNLVKAVRQDSFLTNRFIYSMVLKHGAWLMKREDSTNKLMRFASIMQTLDSVELVEVDLIEAGCIGLKTGITMMRTKDKLPAFMQGYFGPLIRSITSVDGVIEFQMTNPNAYTRLASSKNFKYNKTNYCWYINGYIYFPDIKWPIVRIEGVFQDDIAEYKCPTCTESWECKPRTEQQLNIPDYLFGELESNVLKELLTTMQIPSENVQDLKSNIR